MPLQRIAPHLPFLHQWLVPLHHLPSKRSCVLPPLLPSTMAWLRAFTMKSKKTPSETSWATSSVSRRLRSGERELTRPNARSLSWSPLPETSHPSRRNGTRMLMMMWVIETNCSTTCAAGPFTNHRSEMLQEWREPWTLSVVALSETCHMNKS